MHFFGIKLENNKIILNDEDKFHIKKVLRVKENQELKATFENKKYLCSYKNEELEIIKQIENNEIELNIILYVPILSEEKMDFILQKATELGVKEIIPVYYTKCKFKISNEKQEKKLERWNSIIKNASMQSERTNIPKLQKIIKFNNIKKVNGINILCSTDKLGVKKVKEVLKNINNSDIIQIVFGPEAGFSEEEQTELEKTFTKTTFGSRILRTETVPIYLLSIINFMLEMSE